MLWYNPRTGGEFKSGSVKKVKAGKWVEIGTAPIDIDKDWAVLIKKE